MTKGTFLLHNQDHLGNNREVVDAGGHVQQVTNYYSSGVPYADPNAEVAANFQPYKYNGKELDRMHGLDTYDYGARQYNPIVGRWDRIDPLCEKYYSVSPYAYCAGNPVNRIDPDGSDVWDVNSQGHIENYIQTEEYDQINVVNNQGEVGASIMFDYGSVTHETVEPEIGGSYELFTIKGDDKGRSTFEMLAQNTDVEWTLGQFDKESNINNILTTSHQDNFDKGLVNYLSTNISSISNLRRISHNHPSGSIFPSIETDEMGKTKGDLGLVKYFNKRYPDNKIQYDIYIRYLEALIAIIHTMMV